MSTTNIWNRYIPAPIYPRMVGYTATLAMHVINAVNMLKAFADDKVTDSDIRQFNQDQLKFLTIWNVCLQLFYAALGLSCDVLTLTNKSKDSILLKTLKTIRNNIFSSLVFPVTVCVFTIFWTLFSYERSFILPPSVDIALGSTANHVIHTMVLPVVLWEILFLPRQAPKSHALHLIQLNTFLCVYLIVLVTSYIQLGTWVYPILNMIDGTIFCYVFFGVAIVVMQVSYYLQWYLTRHIWENPAKVKKVD